MVLIFTICAVAVGITKAFNALPALAASSVVQTVTQHTSVLLALTTAVQWVMRGLQGLTNLATMPTASLNGGHTIRIGRPAGDS